MSITKTIEIGTSGGSTVKITKQGHQVWIGMHVTNESPVSTELSKGEQREIYDAIGEVCGFSRGE